MLTHIPKKSTALRHHLEPELPAALIQTNVTVVTITYSLSEQELIRWMWRENMRRSVKFILWYGAIGIGIVWSGTGLAQFFGIMLLITLAMAPYSAREVIVRSVKEKSNLTESVTVEFSEKGLTVIRRDFRAEVLWSHYRVFGEDKDYFEFATSSGDISHKTIIPKRAFPSAADMDTFRRFASQGIMSGQIK